MNLHTWGLLYAGKYGASLAAAERALSETEEFGIDFVVAHAELAKINALIGLRQFTSAARVLTQMTRRLELTPDEWVTGNVALAQAFLRVSVGDLHGATQEILLGPDAGQTAALWAEFHATRAMIAAASRSTTVATHWLALSEEKSSYAESHALCAVTRAILATHAADSPLAGHYFSLALSTGHRHSIVMGCRACPALAQLLVKDSSHQSTLRAIFSESADVALAKAVGIRAPRTRRRSPRLSDRELEVYELLVQGRTNRQIADVLFIAESTTKVHVKHIFEKLGVRSRVEAAQAWSAATDD
jgi:DNA-binding NarL/FixJ family response regulator